MGLLDAFLKGTGDPEKDAAINRGLMAAGLQLMQARGRLFPALGQAGMIGINASDQMMQQQQQAKMQALQRKMVGYQANEAQRAEELAKLPGQFYRAPSEPVVDATGGMETASEAPQNASGPGGFDLQGYMKALQGMDFNRYLQTAAAMAKKLETIKEGERGLVYNPATGKWDQVAEGAQKVDKPATPLQEYAQVVKDYQAQGKPPPTYEAWDLSRKKATATNVSVPVTMDRTYGGVLAKGLADADVAAIDAARSAPDRVQTARSVKNILATQAPMTGTAATWRLEAAKALSTAGIIDGKSVTSTEDLASLLANQTLDAIKSSGLGSGQGFTDKDRQFLQDAKSGRIELNAGTLMRIADLNERSAIAAINRGNNVVRRLKKDKNFEGTTGGALEEVALPTDGPALPPASAIEAEMRRRGMR